MTPTALPRRKRRRIAAVLLALALAGCRDAPVRQAHPALWEVRDADTVLYLFGTMHALPAGIDWRDGAVEQAIGRADSLVLELAPVELAKAGEEMERLAPRAAPKPVAARLDANRLAHFRPLAARTGIDADALDDWAIVLALAAKAARDAGLSSDDGVEAALAQDFGAAGKPVSGLETARGQLMLFENLSPAAQQRLLDQAIDRAPDARREARQLVDAWSAGDTRQIGAIIDREAADNPEVLARIYTERNRRWAAWLHNRLSRPGTTLVAVGAGHLVGEGGLPALMARDGVSIRRLQ